jgi:hypothetical protein
MNTPGAPQKDTGEPATIWQGSDGRTITGQETAIERADRMEANRRAAENGRDLRGEMDEAASESKTGSAPSTPRKGGTRRRRRTKYGGDGAQEAPRTPEQPARPLVVPGRPIRPSGTIIPTVTATPRRLEFPSARQSRNRRSTQGPSQGPSQGGASLKCGTNSVKQKDARGKISCVRCGRNHVKMWDRRANSYYCGFDPEAYAQRIKNNRGRRPSGGGKKTKRAKRSSKKTRRAHKKRRTHRKRR